MIFLFLLILEIVFRLPEIDFNWLLIETKASGLIKEFDGFLRTFYIIKQNITGLIRSVFFAINFLNVFLHSNGSDWTGFREFLLKLLLSNFFWKESHEDV